MGRRKERRLAAISAAGRRVKLDLFAEPSGDLGGSSAPEEVEDTDTKAQAELHTSPSPPPSSGQQPQNPLLLLEQYSDEELDEGSTEGHNCAVAENTSIGTDDEAKIMAGKETQDIENNDGKEPTAQKAEQLVMDNSSSPQDPSQKLEKGRITGIEPDYLHRQTTKTEAVAILGEHFIGDIRSGWKMVLHEESNQYYYWNIETGETSWEVPDVLAKETVTTHVEKVVGDTEGRMDTVMSSYESRKPLGMEEDDIMTRKLNGDSKVNCQTGDNADQGSNMDASEEGFKDASIDNEEGNRDANESHGTSYSVENKGGSDLSLKLIKFCESLLQRLNTVKGLDCHLEGQDLMLKCTLEIEIRLADIKALASHESSLLPFWLHSECQLKRLEAAIDGVIQRHSPASMGGFGATLESRQGIGEGIKIDSNEKKALFPAGESRAECIPEKSNFEAHNDSAPKVDHMPLLQYSNTSPVNNLQGKSEITGTEEENKSAPVPALPSGEDVDMDVDMEVEDTTPIRSAHGASNAHYQVSTEPSNLHSERAGQEAAIPELVLGVPSPMEAWIPPPPPDNEPFPPPPPDDEPFPPPPPAEPPETTYPLSHLASVQPFSYSEQYTLSYPGSNLEYYGQTNIEVPGATLYTHSEGGQVAVSHLPHYYEPASNVYSVAPLIVNPVEPAAYYDLQNEMVNPVSFISRTTESSATQSEHAPGTLETGQAGIVQSPAEDRSNMLLKDNIDAAKPAHAAVKAPAEVSDAQLSFGVPAISSVANVVPGSSTSDTIASVTASGAAAGKGQLKVGRGKKRTVAVMSTLRSNKKVSSLVDKWKAAKEELNEVEEEPEDAYEILEKKRQREIEEWRVHQIASGEAKDNANFQPLGGDWRERVKRKRAQKIKETEQNSSDVSINGNQPPDLVELSKGLPSGWQVYWDDSSKQVYYGNMLTSETTWSRPLG